MAFAKAKCFAIVCFLGLAGALSMTQQKAGVVLMHAGAPLSLSDVEKQLGKVNDTLDQVSDMLDTINGTAYDLMATFLSSAADFVEILGSLQKAADAASMFGGSDIAEKATEFIDLANSSIAKAQEMLPAIVATVETQIDPMLPAVQKIADSLISEFMDAAQQVLELSNLTDSSVLKKVKQSNNYHSHSAKKHHKDHTGTHHNHRGKSAKNDVALLQERSLRSEGMWSSSVTVDKSVSHKGKSNPCSKALAKINTANKTINAMAAKVQEVNATGSVLLGQIVEVASSALAMLNSTVSPALEAASAIPSKVLSPVTKNLDKILSSGGTLSSTVDDQLSTVQAMLEDAQSMLSTVYSLSDTLVDAVTEAQCQGACGAKMEAACES